MTTSGKLTKIILGSDHVALALKKAVIDYLTKKGVEIVDVGPFSEKESVDYPDYAQLVGHKVLTGEGDSGIAICGTGIGMSIAANKVPGIRAGLCHDPYTAHQARAHNNANVLCMGAWIVSPQRVGGILDEWISTEYEKGRHQQRLLKLENPAVLPKIKSTEKSDEKNLKFGVSLSPDRSVFGPLLFAGQLEEGLRQASEYGFDLIELSLRDPAIIDQDKIQELLSQYGLGLGAIATGQSCLHDSLCLSSTNEVKVQGAVDRIKSHIKFASEFGAAVIIGGIRGKFSSEGVEKSIQYQRALEAVHACAEEAEDKGVQLLIEPINRYETDFINDAESGLRFIEETGHPDIKILLDTFHMNLEEADIDQTIKRYADHIGYIHFADSNRKAPGWGHIPFKQIMRTLLEVGYTGVITAEILPLPDDQRAIQQTSSFFNALRSTVVKD